MKEKVFIGLGVAAVVLVILLALPWYDTDNAMNRIEAQFDLQKISSLQPWTSCTARDGGWGLKAVPFGVVVENCQARFFVLLNTIAFQTRGEPLPHCLRGAFHNLVRVQYPCTSYDGVSGVR